MQENSGLSRCEHGTDGEIEYQLDKVFKTKLGYASVNSQLRRHATHPALD
jgi:hypothetical protein